MRERPILFSAPMVRALLDGTKTQTRRVCKPAQAAALSCVVEVPDPQERGQVYNGSHFGNEEGGVQFASPYGGVGDRLWVREAFRLTTPFEKDNPTKVGQLCLDAGYSKPWAPIQFEADGAREHWQSVNTVPAPIEPGKLRPGIHMPRWASRILLEVTGVRVERLQDISAADAAAEGLTKMAGQDLYVAPVPATVVTTWGTAAAAYRVLWEQINGAGSWDANPWVWAVEFRRARP